LPLMVLRDKEPEKSTLQMRVALLWATNDRLL
jgi:hypothetical protein